MRGPQGALRGRRTSCNIILFVPSRWRPSWMIREVPVALDGGTIFGLSISLVDCSVCDAGPFQLINVFLVFHSC